MNVWLWEGVAGNTQFAGRSIITRVDKCDCAPGNGGSASVVNGDIKATVLTEFKISLNKFPLILFWCPGRPFGLG